MKIEKYLAWSVAVLVLVAVLAPHVVASPGMETRGPKGIAIYFFHLLYRISKDFHVV